MFLEAYMMIPFKILIMGLLNFNLMQTMISYLEKFTLLALETELIGD